MFPQHTTLIQSVTDSEYRDHVLGPLSLQVTIGNLPDVVLLNIFSYYLDTSPQCWPKLVHVCRKWRHIIFMSPRGLYLRLYCTQGTPVLKSLDCWPPLPIVVQYGRSRTTNPPAPSPEDEDNIMAALKHTDRVISINLTVTSSLLEKMGTIAVPFSELEDLVLLSQNTTGVALPSAFKWASRLRSLYSIGFAFPALPELLLSSEDLVSLQLHEIPSVGYVSPEVLANALFGMARLRSLSLHFLSFPSRRNSIAIPGNRAVLPSLEYFEYRGTKKYLDGLVTRIDAPYLEDIDITYFNQPTFNISQLGRFIDRIETQKLHGRADILTSNHAVSICFTRPGASTRLGLQISCEQLDWQLSLMAQVCEHFPAFLSCVGDLGISATPASRGQSDVDNEHWLRLIRPFKGAEKFRVAGELGTAIMRTLLPEDGDLTIVLPLLCNLYVEEPGPLNIPLRAAVTSFAKSRRLSGRPVTVKYIQPMVSPNSTAEDGTSGEPPTHLEVPPPCFISNVLAIPTPTLIEHSNVRKDDGPSFGPFAFLSEHSSLLNDVWSHDPFYLSDDDTE